MSTVASGVGLSVDAGEGGTDGEMDKRINGVADGITDGETESIDVGAGVGSVLVVWFDPQEAIKTDTATMKNSVRLIVQSISMNIKLP